MNMASGKMFNLFQKYPKLISVLVAASVFLVDLVTSEEIHFPLIYVLPVGMAAWMKQSVLAYAMALSLPLLRVGYDMTWEPASSLSIFAINASIEMMAMVLYAYVIGMAATNARQLQKQISTRDQELNQIRSFTRMTGMTLLGRGLSPGMAEGYALLYVPPETGLVAEHYRPIQPKAVEQEIHRLDAALLAAIGELENIREQYADDIEAQESGLVDMHLVMLKDQNFWNRCRQRVQDKLEKIELVVTEEVGQMAAKLEALDQAVMRERAADIRDIGRRVLRNLIVDTTSPNPLAALPPHSILVAKEFLPSDIFQLDYSNVVALVSENNSTASHMAILARSRNIPAVSNIKDIMLLLNPGDHLLVDADEGILTVAPTRIQKELFAERKNSYSIYHPSQLPSTGEESTTKDGIRIGLQANIGKPDEAYLVSEYRLEGVGLFRSEFLFLEVTEPPSLETQIAAYSSVVEMLGSNPLVIRTMDFGGDKIPKFIHPGNDHLRIGKRGLAFSLAEKTLFRTQIRAILQAARYGDVRIMFPMVMGVSDYQEAHQFVAEVAVSESFDRKISIGAMIETPAAVIQFRELAKEVDFVSIGTNDLTQYILVQDRKNQEYSNTCSFLHPSIIRAIDHVNRISLQQGIGVSVCGEAAGNPTFACLLVGMGIRNLSMNPLQAQRVRHALRQMTLAEMETVAMNALAARNQEDVYNILTQGIPVTL